MQYRCLDTWLWRMPKVVSYLILLVSFIMSLILLYCLTTPSRPDCRVIFFNFFFYGFKFCNSLPQAWNENLEWSQIAWNIFLNNKLLFPGLLSLTFLTRFFAVRHHIDIYIGGGGSCFDKSCHSGVNSQYPQYRRSNLQKVAYLLRLHKKDWMCKPWPLWKECLHYQHVLKAMRVQGV